jgi:hypothetical protein
LERMYTDSASMMSNFNIINENQFAKVLVSSKSNETDR